MSQAPTDQITSRRFQPPMNTQFSVFLDNRVGKLLELIEIFSGQAICLAAFSVLESTDHAVVRLVTSNAELARRLLTRHGLPFSETDLLLVELDPLQGRTLSGMCTTLLGAELSIHYAYPLMVRPHQLPTIALHTDDYVLAAQLLRRKLFTLLGENDLGDNATGSPPSGPIPES